MALAGLALERYGVRDARLIPLGRRGGFKQVFRVESPSRGLFVLKTYAKPPAGEAHPTGDSRHRIGPGLRSPETLGAQLAWLATLRRETGLNVPEPVPLSDGSLVGCVSFAGLPRRLSLLRRVSGRHRTLYRPDHPGRHFALLRWVPGEPRRRDDLVPADLSRVGSFVARLHGHAESHRPPEPSALPRWDWHWPFGESAPLWTEGEAFYSAREVAVFEEAARRVREDQEALGYTDKTFGPIHRDLTLENLLFGGETLGATDFDMCGLGHFLFDLAVVVRALRRPDTGGPDCRGHLREALFAGYVERRPLPAGHEGYLATFDAMQRVAAVNRNLELLSSEATRHQARGEGFLRNAVIWLERDYLR